MQWRPPTRFAMLLLILIPTMTFAGELQEQRTLDPEFGIVYRPPSIPWDSQQWNAIFGDPAPPMGWAVLPVGKEGCTAAEPGWLNSAKKKGMRLAILFTPFLAPADITRTIDCAAPLGFRRAVMDEYISYHTKNNGRPLCTVLSEVRSIYNTVKRRHPSFELGINDTWHTWMVQLARGQSPSCGAYPHFKYDLAGVSVLSKYGNPSQGTCDHPTAAEMEEQLIDLKPTVRDYSRSGRIFVWQLNQNWYPGGKNVLQLFRHMKAVYGWDRFPLFGPTTEHPTEENWAYAVRGGPQNCASAGYEWYLPARQYLARIGAGQNTAITFRGPATIAQNSTANFNGRLTAAGGLGGSNIALQYIPPPGSLQSFERRITAPAGTLFALVGIRVNSQLPDPIQAPARFTVARIQLTPTGATRNLVGNGEFDNGMTGWIAAGNASRSIVSEDSQRSLSITASNTQTASITSFPIPVIPGIDYTVRFDARIFQESRNSAYFFVSWNRPGEIRRDRIFQTFPQRRTLATTRTNSDGKFFFSWAAPSTGIHRLFAFFPGSGTYRPAFAETDITVP